MTESRAVPPSSRCSKHIERPAVGACGDCGRALCSGCVVTVPEVGEFCWSCASFRGGIRTRRRRLTAAVAPVTESRLGLGDTGTAFSETEAATLRFEAHRVDRGEERPLISGLTERLVAAGADPLDVVDDDQLVDELTELQDNASERKQRPRRAWLH